MSSKPRLRRALSYLLLVAALGFPSSASAAPADAAAAPAPDPTYAALRGARPDGRKVTVSGLTLERDAFRIQLDSGVVHFLAPVEGRTVGAVFLGEGSWRLTAASETERRHLGLVTG